MSINNITNRSTLLDMLNGNSGSKADEVFKSIIDTNTQRYQNRIKQVTGIDVSGSANSKYEKVSNAATNVTDSITFLQNEALWNESHESYSRENITTAVKNFVSAYNTFVSNMSSANAALKSQFKTELDKAMTENKEMLMSVGISVEEDGRLTVDSDKLSNADTDSLKKIFGEGSGLLSNVKSQADDCNAIVSKALSVQKSMSGIYNSSSNTQDLSSLLSGSSFNSIG
ncbi:MAG: hypothetical protein ACI4D4_07440 [Lachnospira sp.]